MVEWGAFDGSGVWNFVVFDGLETVGKDSVKPEVKDEMLLLQACASDSSGVDSTEITLLVPHLALGQC